MSSVDGDESEPFKLNVASIQGKWLCEELGVSLRVTGQTIQYASGECYPLEVNPEGKLEVFGYRGVEKKSDASSVTWKHKESGQYLTWMYEGDNEDNEPELDSNLIIQSGTNERTTRKRKVDYVALDKQMDEHGTLNQDPNSRPVSSHSAPSAPSDSDIATEFTKLKSRFESWLKSTRTPRCAEILAKRGYLSTVIDYVKTTAVAQAADRLVLYLKSIGAKASISQSGSGVHVRVPQSLWESVSEASSTSKVHEEILGKTEDIKKAIAEFCELETPTEKQRNDVVNKLEDLEALPVDLEILKITRVGVEVNKLSKTIDRAKETLQKLKSVYLDSKK